MEELFSQDALKEIDALLEAEPASGPAAPGPDIPALRENLAVLVSTGKAKEAIGVQLKFCLSSLFPSFLVHLTFLC
jgi:hypothetical protein